MTIYISIKDFAKHDGRMITMDQVIGMFGEQEIDLVPLPPS